MPHVAQKRRGSALEGRTTRHATYSVSQRLRKLVEQIFGWTKTVGFLRKTRHRGRERLPWVWTFTLAAYNLVCMRNVLLQTTSRGRSRTPYAQHDFKTSFSWMPGPYSHEKEVGLFHH